jgi:glycine oxidase
LAEEIRDVAGVDVEFRRTGGVEVARSEEAAASLAAAARARRAHGVGVDEVDARGVCELAPGISGAISAIWMPDMRQVRNPRLLAGLAAACRRAGARIVEGDGAQRVDQTGGRVAAVWTTSGVRIPCRHVVLTAGAWSGNLFASWTGTNLPIRPVQGQILAFDAPGEIATIVLEGKRYLVPRSDGLVLVGSTEEDVGFDKQTTPNAVAELRAFATGLSPSLARRPVRYAWAGLRPGSPFRSPVVGRVPAFENLWVATGHFRHGLQLALGTARLIVDWLAGGESFVAREEFAPGADRSGHQSVFES